MSGLAAVVLAHADPTQFRRLVAALAEVPVFLHCDAGTDAAVFAAMTDGLGPRVHAYERRRTTLSSWSLVDAELRGLRLALDRTDAGHVAVLSAADYPLVSPSTLGAVLTARPGHSWLVSQPMPHPGWDTPRHADGGLWRLRHRFLTRNDQMLYIRDIPLRLPWSRALPPGIEFRAGSQWKIYARRHAEILIDTVDHRPDLVQFFRHSLVPDETFAASILASACLAGADAVGRNDDPAWYTDWNNDRHGHPRWLTAADFPALAAAARGGQVLFARKFATSVDTQVLDRIDTELRDTELRDTELRDTDSVRTAAEGR